MTVDKNGIVYAVAKHFEPELYRSDDLGDSWTQMTINGLPVPTNPAEADFINMASIGTDLFAFHAERENNVMAIYKSTDGNNWFPLSSTPDNFFAVDLHVGESGLLYASGAFFNLPSDNHAKGIAYVSDDQGNTWQLIDTYNLGDYSDSYYVSVASLGDELLLSTINANVDQDFRVFTTLKPQTQSIDFQAIPSKTYGDATFEPVALVTGNSISITAAGATTITASQPGNSSFQVANSVEQLLTVNKATLDVTVINISRDEGESNPEFELNYEGWINGDNLDDLNVKPAASTLADLSSPEGTYAIMISGGVDNNYKFNYIEGILTVNKVKEVVTGLNDHATVTMKVFPNPVSDKLKLMPDQAGISGRVLIYNSTGAIIKNQKFSDQILEMDFNTYPDGIYLIKIISSERSTVHNVVKE